MYADQSSSDPPADAPVEPPAAAPDEFDLALADSVRLLDVLFDRGDVILFRFMESFSDASGRHTELAHDLCGHFEFGRTPFSDIFRSIYAEAAERRLNAHFGVCPRFALGDYDVSWQIRKVGCLWADVDHISVEAALKKCRDAGLPEPTAAVDSGNGAHVYWRLDEPFLIDDVGDPPLIEKEMVRGPEGTKRKKFVVLDGEKVYLSGKRRPVPLSPKAHHVQDLLAGLSHAIGGDATHDLARLLRLPGPPNRKNERSGDVPKPTRIVVLERERRYPLSRFHGFGKPNRQAQREREIQQLPLPSERKLTPARKDRLEQYVAACRLAAPGMRSETDFALCCFAVRNGIACEEVWSRVEDVGKFAERGREYFDRTWEKAAFQCRAENYDSLKKSLGLEQPDEPNGATSDTPTDRNDTEVRRIEISGEQPIRDVMARITDVLLSTGQCFNRAEKVSVIRNDRIRQIVSPQELSGLLNQHVEIWKGDEESGRYVTLPIDLANTWLHHDIERSRLHPLKLFTCNPVYTQDWRLAMPGYDAASGIYYAGAEVRALDGTECIDQLLREFCFKTPGDRTNYVSVLLTMLLISHFIGSKPLVLLAGNQSGLGKSILAQLISILRDARPARTLTYQEREEDFEKRLGSVVLSGAMTIVIDNVRTRGGRIDSPTLERCITDPILSFRLLGASQDIVAENSHLFCVTANTPSVIRDLVNRSVIVNLEYEGDAGKRVFDVKDPETFAFDNRVQLLGELLGLIDRWNAAGRPYATTDTRFNKRDWGNIVGGVLRYAGQPGFLANAEVAAVEMDGEHGEFGELVQAMVEHPRGFFSPKELAALAWDKKLFVRELKDRGAHGMATELGKIAQRFVSVEFTLADGRGATFQRVAGRKGNVYRVDVREAAEVAEVCRT